MHPPAALETLATLLNDASSVVDTPMSASTVDMALSTAQSVATAVATAAAAATSTSSASESIYEENNGECQLLGSFALIVQGALGALALLALVYKRWRERPQRPVKIWFFDASKQVFGSVLVHMANIFMSMLTSGRFSVQVAPTAPSRLMARQDDYVPNPCSFYLLNLGIDTTLGIPILIILLRIFTGLVGLTPIGKPAESIQSGNYGNPPNAWWWLKQSIIYFMGLFGMKLCVLIIFIMMPWISKVGDWALGWTEGNEKLQIAFVMMIFPLIMNAMQYYIIDSFIKKKEQDHERLPTEDPDEARLRRRYDDSDDEVAVRMVDSVSEFDSDDEEVAKIQARPQPKDRPQSRDTEYTYDPDLDGDDRTIIGSGSSGRHEQGKIAPPELFPKE